jgi:hypothetical protein
MQRMRGGAGGATLRPGPTSSAPMSTTTSSPGAAAACSKPTAGPPIRSARCQSGLPVRPAASTVAPCAARALAAWATARSGQARTPREIVLQR